MASDLRTLRRLAEKHGWTVRRTKRDHWIFYDPQGLRVATAAGTASDTRSLKNTVAHLRAAGLPIPHRGGHTKREGNRR